MGAYNAQPGLIYTQDYVYDPRWCYGSDGNLRVISCIASETIPPGVLVQATPGQPGCIQVARNLTALVGVSAFNPAEFTGTWMYYTIGDTIPVVRRGAIFVAFQTLQAPFTQPQTYDTVNFYPGPWTSLPNLVGGGSFTTDLVGTFQTPKICFGHANRDYYQNSDGSPVSDDPNPVPPIAVGTQDVTFGDGVAMVEVNLG